MTDEAAVRRIVARGRAELDARLRRAVLTQARTTGVSLDEAQVDRLVADGAAGADDVLWRRCLAHAATVELGISLVDAVGHGAVASALATVLKAPQAVRLAAVHLHGIPSLRDGEPDVELRISTDGFDVLKRSSGALIGRLTWSEVRSVELPAPRRGLRPGARRDPEVHLITAGGRASFALPGLDEAEVRAHLQPLLAGGQAPT
ncbi:MAG: hypothetical protein ACRDMJ_06930 [Solirubrobacteraceae bacterium]